MLRFFSTMAIAALVIAGCSSDDDATPTSTQPDTQPTATSAPATTATFEPTPTSQPAITTPPAIPTTTLPTLTPLPVAADSPLDIASGVRHSCLVKADGTVWCWGGNAHGQLGNGNFGPQTTSSIPVAVAGISDAIDVDTGSEHTCAVHNTGEVSCWGDNSQGELGNGESAEVIATPTKVAGIEDATAVATGHWHTCALHSTNRISCWGNNNDGQLGNGVAGNPGENDARPVLVSGINDAVAIDVGDEHSCAVHQGGEISCWGDNWRGELGDGRFGHGLDSPQPLRIREISNAVSVSAGARNTCATLATGEVSCWGSNEHGQTGNGQSMRTSQEPMQPSPNIVAGVQNTTAVSVGETFACAKQVSGELMCWGSNFRGQLGNFEVADHSARPVASLEDVAQIAAGSHHACAVLVSGEVVCWGDNLFGQLGNGAEQTFEAKSVKVANPDDATPGDTTLGDATAVSTSQNHSCALHETGEVSCWGRSWKGRAGDSATGPAAPYPIKLPGISNAVSISAGRNFSCAVLESLAISCWGASLRNDFTESSDGIIAPLPLPTPLQAPAGTSAIVEVLSSATHFCALHEDGEVSCAGGNKFGQLGNGEFNPDFHEWVPQLAVGIDDAVDLSLAYDHSCAATASGAVYCWGRNNHGQLGTGELSVTYSSTIPQQVMGISDAVAVATGSQNISCALHATGEVSCWGQNTLGELGTAVDPSQDHSAVPVRITGIQDAVDLSAGNSHICALLRSGEVYCWGSDHYGQLGTDLRPLESYSATPAQVSGISDAVSIAAGSFHTCAVHENGEITCWGSDTAGQLGDGQTMSNTSSIAPVQVAF